MPILLRYLTNLRNKKNNNETQLKAVADLLDGIERAKKTRNVNVITDLILKHRLVRENVPRFFLNEKQVWLALSRHMPMTALIRNLGKMSNLDIFLQENQRSDKEESFEENLILGKLQNRELILKEKVHPVIFLKAINQYKKGHNSSEKTKWNVLPQICTALENGFYLSFENVRPTGKRFLIAVEISQSMKEEIQVPGTFSLRAIDVAAFMVTLAARTEQHSDVIVFSSETPKPLFIQSTATIDDVNARIQQIADNTRNQASDASWVFKYALQEKKRYDAIVNTPIPRLVKDIHILWKLLKCIAKRQGEKI
ncbi:RNA-binding protein RO60-like [Saccostrea cucullata]|uniref:RNA-binding protein RO60-like n=1 Tax=Saccostrea cuccullata TaxID=36930 RepID=UPI002ED0A7DD